MDRNLPFNAHDDNHFFLCLCLYCQQHNQTKYDSVSIFCKQYCILY